MVLTPVLIAVIAVIAVAVLAGAVLTVVGLTVGLGVGRRSDVRTLAGFDYASCDGAYTFNLETFRFEKKDNENIDLHRYLEKTIPKKSEDQAATHIKCRTLEKHADMGYRKLVASNPAAGEEVTFA